MSLSLTLNNALSGINVAQQSLSVLSSNVANANTEGYSRQVAELSPNTAGTQGAGVRVEQIVRKIDLYLERAVRTQTAEASSAQTVSEYMSRIQILMGEPGGNNSLDEYIENFFNAMQSLAETPELTSFRYEAVNNGSILARELSALAGSLEDLRFQAEQDIQSSIDYVNSEIMRLYEINQSISRAVNMGEPAASFLDQRDIALEKLAEHIDLKIIERDNGTVYVYTQRGEALMEHIPYQLQYNGVNSLDTFVNDGLLSPITIDGVDDNGEFIGLPTEIVSAGRNQDITTSLTGGKLKGLLDIRDREIPNLLSQLDLIAAELRDQFNAIHNSGSGLPPASTLTGTRSIGYENLLEWTGGARIAVLNADGTPVSSRYGHTDSGFLPLDLNFDQLRSEFGDRLTTQTIIDEINAHFLPQNKAVVGNLNDIRMSAISNTIPDGTDFSFDLELENISSSNANFWVTNVTVLDDTANPMAGAASSTIPTAMPLNAVGTFGTTAGSATVTVNSTGHGLSEGDVVYLNGVGGPIDGIPAADFNGRAFKISNVTANSYDITITTGNVAAAGAGGNAPAATALPTYAQQAPGQKDRTGDNGDFTLDLSSAPGSSYYTVQMDVMVEDDNGNLTTSTVDYRVANNQNNIINQRYSARAVAGGGTLEIPTSSQTVMRARLVDEDGNVVGPNESGFLQLVASNLPGQSDQKYTIAIDDLSSKDLGLPDDNPAVEGSGRGFSHYFELNNFFVSNNPTHDGDTVNGSAYAMAVRQDIVDNPNLVSLGTLTQSPGPADQGAAPYYTYERASGENSVAQSLAGLGLAQLDFSAAGGLPTTTKSFNGYASEVLGYAAGRAASAEGRADDQQTLLDGFRERADAVSGVNIDEEMANTIIFQNAYSASAQVIRTVKELFDTLMASF